MLRKFKQYFDKLTKDVKKTEEKSVFDKINDLYNSLNEDTINLCIGSDLVKYSEVMVSTTASLREELKDKTGFILPPVRFLENNDIQENEVLVKINGKEVFSNFAVPDEENVKKEIESVINEIYENYISEIFSNEITEKYIDIVKKNNYKLSLDVCYRLASVEIKYILVDLLKHKKSINNIVFIFEKISEQLYIDNTYCRYELSSISEEIIKNI